MKPQPVLGLNLVGIVYTQVVKWNPNHLCKMNHRLQFIESIDVCRKYMPGCSAQCWAQIYLSHWVGREKGRPKTVCEQSKALYIAFLLFLFQINCSE